MTEIRIRGGSIADSALVFPIFLRSIVDLGERLGVETITGGAEPGTTESLWERRRPLFDHLAATADRFFIAESDGRAIGYARSTRRAGLRELTEFFVEPGAQSAGCGRRLLEQTMAPEEGVRRCLIATPDVRAVALYLRQGLCARFPIYYFSRAPRALPSVTGLEFSPLAASPPDLAALADLDRAILGHVRDEDHRWLASQREGFVARRHGLVIGYGYVAEHSGPFAALDAADLPLLLTHAENRAAARGLPEFGIDVPLVNREAFIWLLDNHYRIADFATQFMSDEPFGRFENYLVTTPSFFL